jgi:copper transport protein
VQTSPGRDVAIWLGLLALYIGLFAGIGGIFFAIWIARIKTPVTARRRQPQLDALLALGVVGAVVSLALQGLDLLDTPVASLLTAAPWRAALATSLIWQLGISVAAMIVAGVALRTKTPIAKVLAALALLGVGGALASSGHAATAEPRWLTVPSIFLHGMAVTYWAGALLPLVMMLRQAGPAYAGMTVPVLERFSRGAELAVAALLGTGIALAYVQLGRVSAFIDTAYGNLLGVKLAAVLGLLGLAALNRFGLTPALRKSGEASAKLVRSILVEGALVFTILGIVAGWRFTPPPRALDEVAQDSLSMHLMNEDGMVQITITPGRIGKNKVELQFMDDDLKTVRVKDATISLTQQDDNGKTKDIEGLGETHATERPDGTREADGVVIPQPGRWSMRVDGLITDFNELDLEGPFVVPPPVR